MYSCHKKWFLTSLRRAYSHAAAGPNILCRRTLHKFASGRRAGQTHLREIFARNFGSKSSKIQRTPSSSTITLLSQSDSKCIESPGFGASKGILNALQITSFDEKALRKYFDAMDLDRSETLSRQEVLSFLKRTEQNGSAEEEGAGDEYGSTRQEENVCEAIGDSHIHQSSIRSSDPPAAPGEDYLERVLLRKFFDDTADEISFETFQRYVASDEDAQTTRSHVFVSPVAIVIHPQRFHSAADPRPIVFRPLCRSHLTWFSRRSEFVLKSQRNGIRKYGP